MRIPQKIGTEVLALVLAVITLLPLVEGAAAGQDVSLQVDPQRSTIQFTLGDVLHTVHGTFKAKRGSFRLDPLSGKVTGEIVVDARSGESGGGLRDKKMHREILDSERYPDIIFRPDHVDGVVALQGKSSVKVHGMFSIHGSDHELTVPADVDMNPDRWTATLHFAVPYVKWGIKNPSTLFLRVSESVDIDLAAVGTIARP
jgi:polyisoprenoid-binding protein YceI